MIQKYLSNYTNSQHHGTTHHTHTPTTMLPPNHSIQIELYGITSQWKKNSMHIPAPSLLAGSWAIAVGLYVCGCSWLLGLQQVVRCCDAVSQHIQHPQSISEQMLKPKTLCSYNKSFSKHHMLCTLHKTQNIIF